MNKAIKLTQQLGTEHLDNITIVDSKLGHNLIFFFYVGRFWLFGWFLGLLAPTGDLVAMMRS